MAQVAQWYIRLWSDECRPNNLKANGKLCIAHTQYHVTRMGMKVIHTDIAKICTFVVFTSFKVFTYPRFLFTMQLLSRATGRYH